MHCTVNATHNSIMDIHNLNIDLSISDLCMDIHNAIYDVSTTAKNYGYP